jgi:hypothetical protein
MTLKKDAMIAVSLAGVVLILAMGSAKVRESFSRTQSPTTSRAEDNPQLLKTYIEFLNSKVRVPSEESELRFFQAREAARKLYESGRLSSPIDLMRASAIFASSTDPKDLSLSHDLAVDALARGVLPARRIVLESEDRLLLSSGRAQRYGTQEFWMGKRLPGGPFPASSELTPKEQNTLRTGTIQPTSVSD